MAGYSGTPLIRKLGIKPGFRVVFLNVPDGYRAQLGDLPDDVQSSQRLGKGADFVHFFTDRRAALERRFPALKRGIGPSGMLWVSWPKRSSGVATDLDGNLVREIGLRSGLVDVKVCAVDDVWSGLKFVYRVRDRR